MQNPEEVATELLGRFVEERLPRRLERIHAEEDWLTTPGELPRFSSPTLFLGIEGEQTLQTADTTTHLRAGEALFMEAGVASRTFAFNGEGSWIGLSLDSRPFTIYGQHSERGAFAAAMTMVEGWPFFRQLRRTYELLTRPEVQMPSADTDLELVRLIIRQVQATVERFPWHGGNLPQGNAHIPAPAVVGASAQRFGTLFVDRSLRRADVAQAIGVSESYLATVFQEHLDTNLTDYLLLRRLTHADGLLLGGTVPVAEIAELCGFTTSNYFIRAFKKLRSTTPLQIRKITRKSQLTNQDVEQMFSYSGFERLEPSAEFQAHATSHQLTPTALRPLMIANATREPITYDWQHEPGEFFEYSSVPPLNVALIWHPAPVVWRIRSGKRIIGHYSSQRTPCQILVQPRS